MSGGYKWGDQSHPDKCSCGYVRKPKERFVKVSGQWRCSDCVKNMKRGVRR